MPVYADRMTELRDLACHRRVAEDLLARQEERGRRLEPCQRVENGRCALGMRAVVKGKRNASPIREMCLHTEQARELPRRNRSSRQRPQPSRS